MRLRASSAPWPSHCVSRGIAWLPNEPGGAGARARRRLVRTRRSSCHGAARSSPRRTGHHHDRQRTAPGSSADHVCGRVSGRVSGHVEPGVTAYLWTRGRPVPISRSLDSIMKSLRGTDRIQIGGVFGRWDDAVGPTVAAHVRPVRLDEGRVDRRGRRTCMGHAGQVPERHDHDPARRGRGRRRSSGSKCGSRRPLAAVDGRVPRSVTPRW